MASRLSAMTLRAALLAVALLLLPQGARAQAPPPVPETVVIPLIEKRPLGARRELHLEGFLCRPPAPGRVPVLVFRDSSGRAGRRRSRCSRPSATTGTSCLPGEVRAWRTAMAAFLAGLDLGGPRVTQ